MFSIAWDVHSIITVAAKTADKCLGETVLTLKDFSQCALCIFFCLVNVERFVVMHAMYFFFKFDHR